MWAFYFIFSTVFDNGMWGEVVSTADIAKIKINMGGYDRGERPCPGLKWETTAQYTWKMRWTESTRRLASFFGPFEQPKNTIAKVCTKLEKSHVTHISWFIFGTESNKNQPIPACGLANE